jgi:pectinesterase
MSRAISLTVVFLLLMGPLPLLSGSAEKRLIVASDGSGDFQTIGEALEVSRAFQDEETVIYIKNGTYREKLHIDSFLSRIRLLGESAEKTIITYDDYAALNDMGTFRTYTLKITGNDITLENLTVQNTAGFTAGQAVALHVEGDRFKAINCRIIGNQDTLYAAGDNSRQYYRDCLIEGSTDFIFGSATAIFDYCTLYSKKNSYITAANTPEGTEFGYVFRHCKLTSQEGVDKVYLGRPWRDYARVVYLNCHMGAHIEPEGWHNWSRPEREKTAFYAEFESRGPGSAAGQRVTWSHQLTGEEAAEYTEENIYRHCSFWKVPSER